MPNLGLQGLVGSDWGGQRVEAFSSPDALKDTTCGGTQPHDDANAYNARQNDGTGMAPRRGLSGEVPAATWQQPEVVPGRSPPGPSQLWNGMIHPLINMRFKGAAWYQGEANDGQYASYCCRFPAMIADWRQKMGLALPFFWVQLAPPGTRTSTSVRTIPEGHRSSVSPRARCVVCPS